MWTFWNTLWSASSIKKVGVIQVYLMYNKSTLELKPSAQMNWLMENKGCSANQHNHPQLS